MKLENMISALFEDAGRQIAALFTTPSDEMLALLARYERRAAWQGDSWTWDDLAEAPEELARLRSEGPSRDAVHDRCAALVARDSESQTPLIHEIASGAEEGMVARVQALVAAGADVNGASLLKSVPLGHALHRGFWEVAEALIALGADPAKVGLTDLHQAVRLGTAEQVAKALVQHDPLLSRRHVESALWLSVDAGRLRALEVILAHLAATARMDAPETLSCFRLAISRGDLAAVHAFLAAGVEPNEGLEGVLQYYDLPILQLLLGQGADVHEINNLTPWWEDPLSVLDDTGQPRLFGFIAALLAAGWRPEDLDDSSLDQLRFVTGAVRLPAQTRLAEGFALPATQFAARENPTEVTAPWHIEMLRRCETPHQLRRSGMGALPRPAWTASRFGQTTTHLPDGRWVQIGGEHEDFYDPDFQIFSDVVVIEPAGGVRVFLYPGTAFPPTDFHTATRIGDDIWIIGNCGYRHDREVDETPVFRLSLHDFSITPVATRGAKPGWISRHKARVEGARITVFEGDVWTGHGFVSLAGEFTLDTATGEWVTPCP